MVNWCIGPFGAGGDAPAYTIAALQHNHRMPARNQSFGSGQAGDTRPYDNHFFGNDRC